MRRILAAASAVAVVTSLVATPSMASTAASQERVPGSDRNPNAIYVPADDLSQNADALGRRLRDKMPFISSPPTLVGNTLVWQVDVSPMRLSVKKGVSLLDRVGGTVVVSRAGTDIRRLKGGVDSAKLLATRQVLSRVITKAGPQQFTVTLPAAVASELRRLPRSQWASRLGIVMVDDKDTMAGIPGYDRKQIVSSNLPKAISNYLAKARAKVEPSGWRSPSPRTDLSSSQQSNTPGTILVYNGSPFDLAIDVEPVQCNVSPFILSVVPSSVASGTSVEWFNIGSIAGNWFYESNQSFVDASVKQPSNVVGKQAIASLQTGALVNHITDDFARGLNAFASTFTVGLLLKGVLGSIANFKKASEACTNAGSAMNIAWTNLSVGTSQTAGNVNYWVPTFNQTQRMVGVPPTSLPSVAPGSPLTGYNATSQNGLAVNSSRLAREVGLGGTVTLTTLNSDQHNYSGNYYGFWCNFTNQQTGNPNSKQSTSQYGSTSLGGGTTASWGPCNATSVNTDADYNATNYDFSGPGSDLENEGFTFLIGYSSTNYSTAGPAPAVVQPTTAADAASCVASETPCAFFTPAQGSTPAVMGCTPGTWNMLTPWDASSSTINLSSPPSTYNAQSQLTMELAFTGVNASGAPVTYFAPTSLGGSVTSSFSPSAVNLWQLTPANLAAVQQVLGGPGGYVSQWLCVMTATTTIPSGIPPTSTAMNLGWYGVPVIVPLTNPAGNALSPPA